MSPVNPTRKQMSTTTDPCSICGERLCATCGEHVEHCDHEIEPSLELRLHVLLLGARNHPAGARPLAAKLAGIIESEARAQAAQLLTDAASILDQHWVRAQTQGGERHTPPLSPGDVAAALRRAAAPPIPPPTPIRSR